MMSDSVKWLRQMASSRTNKKKVRQYNAAADEIELLRDGLEEIAGFLGLLTGDDAHEMREIAERALTPDQTGQEEQDAEIARLNKDVDGLIELLRQEKVKNERLQAVVDAATEIYNGPHKNWPKLGKAIAALEEDADE